jgi:hypothetical protein
MATIFSTCLAVSFLSTRACCKTDTFQTVYSAPPGDSSVSTTQNVLKLVTFWGGTIKLFHYWGIFKAVLSKR